MFPRLSLSLQWTTSLFGKEIAWVARGWMGGLLCSVGRRYWQNGNSCIAQALTACFSSLPSGSSPVGRKVKRKTRIQPWESQMCSLSMFNSEQKKEDGFSGSRGIVVSMTPGDTIHCGVSSTEWQQHVCHPPSPLLCFPPKLAHPSDATFQNQSCHSNLNFTFFFKSTLLIPGKFCQNYSQLWHDLKSHSFTIQICSPRTLGPITQIGEKQKHHPEFYHPKTTIVNI